MNDDVAAYFSKGAPWQEAALRQFREAIMRAVPKAEEAMQYGKPHYSVNGEFVAALHLAAGKVSLLILNARSVPAEKGFTRSLGDGSRKVVDITEAQQVDVDRVAAILAAVQAA